MKDPKPINLMTPDEVRARGWVAEARDVDGHLLSMQGWLDICDKTENANMLGEFIAEYSTDCDITIFPENMTSEVKK